MSTAAKAIQQPAGSIGSLQSGDGRGAKLEAKFFLIPVGSLSPSPTNPRKEFAQGALDELAESIAQQGIHEPLVVRPMAGELATDLRKPTVERDGLKYEERYEIVMGERRWRAAKLAKLELVPCIVRMLDDEATLDAQLTENLQRRDLTPLEEGAAYQLRLKAAGDAGHKMTVADLAKRLGKATRTVYDRIELLKLGADAKEALESGYISASHASELVRLKPEMQARALTKILEGGFTLMQLRCWIVDEKGRAERRPAYPAKSSMPTKAQKAHYLRATQARRPFDWTAAEIKRELRDAMKERFGRDFHVARIASARKRGEWIAVLSQAPVKPKSRKRAA